MPDETHELPRIRREDYERMIRVLQDQVALLQQQVGILQGHSRELYDR